MIWHIFRKDLKQLWPLVAAVAAGQFINALLQHLRGHFPDESLVFPGVAGVFPIPVAVGAIALILICVHQDVIPGVRQDWLIRPIRRRDLLLAKLLFLLLAIHGPMLLADLVHGLAAGFSFLDSLTAALSRGISLLLAFSLPIFAIAAMTSSLVEAIGGALLIWLIAGTTLIGGTMIVHNIGADPALFSYSLTWMAIAFWCAVALAAALVIIPLQYSRRATMRARFLALCAAFLAPVTTLLPWTPAWSFQQWVSGSPAAAQKTTVAYDPDVGKYQKAVEDDLPGPATSTIGLPLRVSGLPAESMLITDRAVIRLIDNDGTILFVGEGRAGARAPFYGISARTEEGGAVGTHGLLILPRKVYEVARARPVRVEVDYWLTLFGITQRDSIAALHADKRTRDFGWCKARWGGDGIVYSCLNPGRAPPCHSATFQGRVSPEFCFPNYDPLAVNIYPDAIGRHGYFVPWKTDGGASDRAQSAGAQVTLKSYRIVSHFKRRVVIPAIRLDEWEAAVDKPAAKTTQ